MKRSLISSLLGLLGLVTGRADAQVISFAPANYLVMENAGSMTFCLTRTEPLQHQASAGVTTIEGTATSSPSGLDYLPWTNAPVFFQPGDPDQCATVVIVDDTLDEGDAETFKLRITYTTSPYGVGVPEATVIIADDDFTVPEQGVGVSVDDNGQFWAGNRLIRYEITVTNNGPAYCEDCFVLVSETVPVGTSFVSEASTPGWSCRPGKDEGSICNFTLYGLGSGARRILTFAVRVHDQAPPGFEIWNEVDLAESDGKVIATDSAITRPRPGPACLCLFGPSICGG